MEAVESGPSGGRGRELHYKEFITENKEQFTIHDDEFSFYHFFLNTISAATFP